MSLFIYATMPERSIREPTMNTEQAIAEIWALFRETDRKFQETDRKFQETNREIKEVNASIGRFTAIKLKN